MEEEENGDVELWSARGCGLKVIYELKEVVDRMDEAGKESVQLKKTLLKKIKENCIGEDEEEQCKELALLVDMVVAVTDRGYNALVSEDLVGIVSAIHAEAHNEGSVTLKARCLELASRTTPSPADAPAAIEMVWTTFDPSWGALPTTVLKDGLLLLKSLQEAFRLSAVSQHVARNYLRVLCMGCTLQGTPLPIHTPSPRTTTPQDEPALPEGSPQALTFPQSSAALWCREALLSSLDRDLYHALYHLRVFLQTRPVQSPTMQRLSLLENSSLPTIPPADVAVIRGAITSLKYFIFGQKQAEGSLSTKELLVVLTALRYSTASFDVAVICDVTLFMHTLLSSSVAWHLESHWHIILDILTDLVKYCSYDKPVWLTELLCKCLQKLYSLKDRIELDMDKGRAIDLLDVFSENLKDSKDICIAIFQRKLSGAGDLTAAMNKYFVSDLYPMEIRKEFFRLFRNSNPHTRPGYLNVLFNHISREGETFARWNPTLTTEVMTYLIELVSNLEGSAVVQTAWVEVVKVCRDIVMQIDPSPENLTDKRRELCSAMIKSANNRLITSAVFCTELWHALIVMLGHKSSVVRNIVLEYFLGLTCNGEFEVTEEKGHHSDAFVQAVCRPPLSSVEAELPVAQLLDAVTSKLTQDYQCFSTLLRVARHLLTNNYFIAGNISKNTPPLMRLSAALSSLLADGGWAILAKIGQAVSLQDITATTVALIPYAHAVEYKEELAINIIKTLSATLKRLLDTQSLVPSGAQGLLPLYCDVFGAIHVVLYELCTLSDLEHSPKQVEAVSEMVKVVGGAVLKATVVVENIRSRPATASAATTAVVATAKSSTDVGALLLEPVTVHSASHPSSPAAREPSSPNVHEASSDKGQSPVTPAAPSSLGCNTQSPVTQGPPAQDTETLVHCKQYIVSLLSLIHSLATSPLVDDNMPCKIPKKTLHTFTEYVFKLLVDVTDTLGFNHRVHFLAHLVVAELLQQNKRGMLPERTRQDVLRKLIATLKSSKKHEKEKTDDDEDPMLGRTRSSASIETSPLPKAAAPFSGDGKDLIKATADLAWRLFYLGSADAYPQWDPLTEAFFAEGETQCWVTQGPHAPCVVTTTVGRSQHMLVTIRSLSSVCCWTCILHNKPTIPPYLMKPYAHPLAEHHVEQLLNDDLRSFTAESLIQEHEEEMRGLLRMESSVSSIVLEHAEDAMDGRRPGAPFLMSEEDVTLLGLSKESPLHESPVARTARFVPITDKRDKQMSPHAREDDESVGRPPLPPSSSAHDLTSVNPTPQRSPTPAISTRLMTPATTSLSSDFTNGLGETLANTIHGAFILSMFKMTPAPQRLRWDDQLLRMLAALDKIPCKETHKIGLVYIDYDQYRLGGEEVKHDTPQWSERETCVLSNGSGGMRYQTFMCGLGKFKDLKVAREDPRETVKKGIWPHPCHYFGALDNTSRQADGSMCLMHETPVHQVVYHVATIMNSETNGASEASVRSMVDKKKRHIGNDHVVITYCEDPTPDIDPFVLNNELNYINILVQPLAEQYSRVTVHFRDCQENKDRALQELLEEVGFGPALCRSRAGVLVRDARLSEFVGCAALHASIATKSWRYERQQYSSNWGDRLHRINQLATRCSVKPQNRTTDDALLDEYHSKESPNNRAARDKK